MPTENQLRQWEKTLANCASTLRALHYVRWDDSGSLQDDIKNSCGMLSDVLEGLREGISHEVIKMVVAREG